MNATQPVRGDGRAPGASHVSFAQAVRVWCQVAALSFGGPTGQIAVMHRLLVEERRWISESRFIHALNFCMLLPGPEAQQLATYIGWLMHGVKGGLAAGVLFILPGFVAILAASVLYVTYHDANVMQAIFYGLKPAVLAIVVEAVMRIGRRVLKNPLMLAFAAASFVAIFFFKAPFPAIVAIAALLGAILGRVQPGLFPNVAGHAGAAAGAMPADAAAIEAALNRRPDGMRTAGVVLLWLAIWFAPLAAVAGIFGWHSVYAQEGLFFSKAAVVTFGGAYAVLPYVGQQAVERFGWVAPAEMLDGLGLAETTPGPLIMVLQFVGFLGASRAPQGLPMLAAGLLGSVITTWCTFAPCFLWIFAGAGYVERLRGNRALAHALGSVTAAVVGVVLNLAVWFALKTMLVETARDGALRPWSRQIGAYEVDLAGLLIAAAAAVALLRFKANLFVVLGASSVAGAIIFAAG